MRGRLWPNCAVSVRKSSTLTSGATSNTFLILSPTFPDCIAFDRSASSVTAQPIECASTVISATLGLSESVSSNCSSASWEELALSRSAPYAINRTSPRDGQEKRTGIAGAFESCEICANRYTASSNRLLKPWTKTRTLLRRVCLAVAVRALLNDCLSRSSAETVTKSCPGSPGRAEGHCTSPIFLALSGGIETAIAAYETSDARSLPNISPGSAIKRFRVVATRIGTRVAPSADCAFGTRTPWSGRPAHEQHRSTSAMLISVEKTFSLIKFTPHQRDRLRIGVCDDSETNAPNRSHLCSSASRLLRLSRANRRP